MPLEYKKYTWLESVQIILNAYHCHCRPLTIVRIPLLSHSVAFSLQSHSTDSKTRCKSRAPRPAMSCTIKKAFKRVILVMGRQWVPFKNNVGNDLVMPLPTGL